jgi:site-specific DNA-methyltransferase (adenine-specific)
MAHWSEDSQRLGEVKVSLLSKETWEEAKRTPTVSLVWLPVQSVTDEIRQHLIDYCAALHTESTVCILTSPVEAAKLLPHLEAFLKFQLWVAVKTVAITPEEGKLPQRHVALLVLTRYRGTLRHTKTRIGYSYCPACGKTTKDYGGKKHVYHEYGTLMSDVWRDIECDPAEDISLLVDRLRDVFGIPPYQTLTIFDQRSYLRNTANETFVREEALALEWRVNPLPQNSHLINADCLSALATLPDNSVDFCFADPPYNLKKQYDRWDDALESREYFAWCDQWLGELYRVLKPGRTLAVLNIPLWSVRHFQYLESRMTFQNWIVWDALSFPVRLIMPAHYTLLCFSKGKPRDLPGLSRANMALPSEDSEALLPLAESFCLRASCVQKRHREGIADTSVVSDLWYDIHRLKHNSRRVDHPCQLPPMLMQRLYALYTYPDEIVLDPFNGSGTSTLVAHQVGRRFIGIELSEQYHQLAEERHEIIRQGGNPFAKQDEIPKAKNSPVERLQKQRYAISKKLLQLEVRRVARELGRLPTRDEMAQQGNYPIEYYDQYFLSWGEVCAAARTTGMSELPPDIKPSVKEPQLQTKLEF